MSVPQSTSKKDPNRARRNKERAGGGVPLSPSTSSIASFASGSASTSATSSTASQQQQAAAGYYQFQPQGQLPPRGVASPPGMSNRPFQQQQTYPSLQQQQPYGGVVPPGRVPPGPALMSAPPVQDPSAFPRPLSSFEPRDPRATGGHPPGVAAGPSGSWALAGPSQQQGGGAYYGAPPPVGGSPDPNGGSTSGPRYDQDGRRFSQQSQLSVGGPLGPGGYVSGHSPPLPQANNAFAGPSSYTHNTRVSPPPLVIGGSGPLSAPVSTSGSLGTTLGHGSNFGGGRPPQRDLVMGTAMGSAERLLGFSKSLLYIFRRSSRDEYLVKTMDVFCSNLSGHVSRLVARELELTGQESRALASIARDFDKAGQWMEENHPNLSSGAWPPDRVAKAIKDLDDRLTKAFTSKLAVALFEAVQDTRQMSMQISRQIEGLEADLPGMIKRIVGQANSETIGLTINRLREEENALGPQNGQRSTYGGGEAEKTIQSLIDALETARLTQREKEERTATEHRLLGTSPNVVAPSNASVRSVQSDVSYSPSQLSTPGPGGLSLVQPLQGLSVTNGAAPAWPKEKQGGSQQTPEGIWFQAKDPISKTELIDPVLASDGYIHDRWTLISERPEHPRKPGVPLLICGEVIQLRSAIFAQYPERRDEFLARRASYLVEAVKSYDKEMAFTDSLDVLRRLSEVLAWQMGEEDVGILVRRALLRWRLRHLMGALEDLQLAVKLTPSLPVQHYIAMIHLEMRSYSLAEAALALAIARNSHDPIALSIRSIIHSSHGRGSEAYKDVEAAAQAAASPHHTGQHETLPVQTSRDSKASYTTIPKQTPSTSLPEIPDLAHLFVGFAYLCLSESVRATTILAKALALCPTGDPFTRSLWGYALAASGEESARGEGTAEMESAWKLAGDIGRDTSAVVPGELVNEKMGKEGRPLKSAIGLLLAQIKADSDPDFAKTTLLSSFAEKNPGTATTAEEHGFLAGLYASTGEWDKAGSEFDRAVSVASSAGRHEEREGLMAERARFRI